MNINKILICGSSYLTKKIVDFISPYYNLVGYIPSKSHLFNTEIDLPIVDFNVEYDIILSLQFDQKIKDTKNSYNLHTGILPQWGGCDILYHTLKSNVIEQGLTFHKITSEFDKGPIISKTTYPIFQEDKMIDLYRRMMKISPSFTLSSLKLLEILESPENCPILEPTLYKRGNIEENDKEIYSKFPLELEKYIFR
tara:strand:- start:3835 stop:4422 length:588 start_codon:yes stop_codon:yes gene_type:complete